ncbi:MAG: accessory Sec system translocase SecA2 [Propionibacteriaceae bacterium]|nr:accessory Sec system translocase SecA2 [Propionibacteriaceae bacterium]
MWDAVDAGEKADPIERLRRWVVRVPGTENLRWTQGMADRAAKLAVGMASDSDDELRQRLDELGPDFIGSDQKLVQFLAVMRELADRAVGLRAFDVQLRAVAAMLRGTSVEMATGEGKTLVGAIVAVGLVKAGNKVHVLAANDYLATRDAAWMGPVMERAQVSVSAITSHTPRSVRPDKYAADVVYIPVIEAGFDQLRDRLVLDEDDMLGIATEAAILDEADAVLLDEGRVPLVLAGSAEEEGGPQRDLARFAATLVDGVDFQVDQDRRTVHLEEPGLEKLEQQFGLSDLFGEDQQILAEANTALYAQAVVVKDVDYVVEDGRVRLVSPSRGRVDALRRWPEGLQEAVEAKERLKTTAHVRILDQILVQDLVGMYPIVVGMSATLVSAAEEIYDLYHVSVGPLPPNQKCIRVDSPDILYASGVERDVAAVETILEAHGQGQPILVATQSVARSQEFAEILAEEGLDAVVLNAKNDQAEGEIIAEAGTVGRITVSTQMAGRGTDIRLGPGAAELGGLLIVALARFPNPRLDGQLRGRAGRQGDPGRTVFLTSLDDDLIRDFAEPGKPSQVDDDAVVHDKQFLKLMGHAQRVSNGQQRNLRQLSEKYGRLLADQRQGLMQLRQEILCLDSGMSWVTPVSDDRMAELRNALGEAELSRAVRHVLLLCLDRLWSDHLAYAAEVREGIHLRRLAGEDPDKAFNTLIAAHVAPLVDDAVALAAGIIDQADVIEGKLDLSGVEKYRPGATWTYTVTDDHFGTAWERVGKWVKEQLVKR